MDIEIQHTMILHIVDCASCGIPFGITKQLENSLRNSHEGFYCPQGHSNIYAAESAIEKLKRELEQKNKQLKEVSSQNENLKRQISVNGSNKSTRQKQSCPHCGKRYKHLNQHIKIMHAEVLQNN